VRETKSKLKQLKDTIGESCRDIVVLEYGTNPDQQIENMAILNRFADSLRDGDEIYFDISHAFRSLPFYELLTVHLAQSILKRKVHIEMVSYAMLEASSIFAGKTPIVDMTQLIELLDWTRAVDEFNSKGTTFQLQSLLSGNNKIGARLKTLLHMNVWNAFNKLTETLLKETYDYNLQSMVGDVAAALKNSNSNLDDPVLLIINNVMTEVANYFSPYKESPAALCVAFALWKIEKKQPTLGVLLLMDAMENVLLELLGKNIHSDKEHDSIHERLLIRPISDNNEYARTFYNYYKEVRRLRNNVAHVNLKQLKDSHYKAKQIAKWYLNSYKNHFSTGKNDREVFRLSLLQ
jgi:hypothetical protein